MELSSLAGIKLSARFNKNQSAKFIELTGQLFNTQLPTPHLP